MPKDTQIKGANYGQIENNNLDEHVLSPQTKNTITLESGKNAMSLKGGFEYPVMVMEVLPGTYIKDYKIDSITRLITPKVPSLDKIFVTWKAFFVPHTRVWKNAEKYFAGKYESGYDYDQSGSQTIPYYTLPVTFTQNTPFRDTLAARYGLPNYSADTRINALILRGYRAIENDFLRNKEYELAKVEYDTDTVTSQEEDLIEAYNLANGNLINGGYMVAPAQTRKGYLTNIKKQLTADYTEMDNFSGYLEAPLHLDWQTRFQDIKQRTENANKNDWDIIAELFGTEPVTADRIVKLGEVDYEMNYQQITQSAPEYDGSSPLGTTGAFSYTRADGTLFGHVNFKQHGYIHILLSVQIEKGYEESTPKELLKIYIDEFYRPALAKKEYQLMRSAEIANANGVTVGETCAFQPPWAEYKRLPRLVTGDMRTQKLTKLGTIIEPESTSQWHNSPSTTLEKIVDGTFFRPYDDVISVLNRNNILLLDDSSDWYNTPDVILNMSEHKTTISSPVQADTINGIDGVKKQR